MVLKFIFYCCLLYFGWTAAHAPCLTGVMTDMQSWVDSEGNLIDGGGPNTLDLSCAENSIAPSLDQSISKVNDTVEYLSMANCERLRVPSVFNLSTSKNVSLYSSVRYMTFYGNNFHEEISYSKTLNWASSFQGVTFANLTELDLRHCKINIINSYAFSGMPTLKQLYLSENNIVQIQEFAFHGLHSLLHLDLSKNTYHNKLEMQKMTWDSSQVFEPLNQLVSLDFSHTKLDNISALNVLGRQFLKLSLCSTGIPPIEKHFLRNTSLEYLDVAGNSFALSDGRSLASFLDTLQILYADYVMLDSIDSLLAGFAKLKIVKLSNNRINYIPRTVVETWKDIMVIDLDDNLITSWFTNMYLRLPNLLYLSLRNNKLNVISQQMLEDVANVSYVGLSGNHFFCNCYSKELYDRALANEILHSNDKDDMVHDIMNKTRDITNFNRGFYGFVNVIQERKGVKQSCLGASSQLKLEGRHFDSKFLLIDYSDESYNCYELDEGMHSRMCDLRNCNLGQRHIVAEVITSGYEKIVILIVTLAIFVIVLGLVWVCNRRSFKYFVITVKNSALLSLINKDHHKEEDAIYHYDVFVSYCNEDRPWVLDELLPQIEKNASVSVCLHERDFQIGLSILENIVSCMDRSRFIMLIISRKFLLSQWCQFEMHIAQHRLLETRREDLILILLEDIPRSLRPTTLHYLMLTKTYIVWSKKKEDMPSFWGRVTKAIITQKMKERNISLA